MLQRKNVEVFLFTILGPKNLALIGGMALLLSLAFSWNARRELQSALRELQTVTKANEFLRNTLADMTVAITAKDREIDRLQHTACDGRGKAPISGPARTGRSKVSWSGAVHAGNNRQIAPAKSPTK